MKKEIIEKRKNTEVETENLVKVAQEIFDEVFYSNDEDGIHEYVFDRMGYPSVDEINDYLNDEGNYDELYQTENELIEMISSGQTEEELEENDSYQDAIESIKYLKERGCSWFRIPFARENVEGFTTEEIQREWQSKVNRWKIENGKTDEELQFILDNQFAIESALWELEEEEND